LLVVQFAPSVGAVAAFTPFHPAPALCFQSRAPPVLA
jgi:hypothetical protein